MSDTAEVLITGLSTDGRGVARHNGSAWFVRGGVPGDRLEIRLLAQTSPQSGELITLLEPSPNRIPHPCPHSHACPGSPFGCITYEEQLKQKHELVRRTLAKFLPALEIASIIPSPRVWHYRNRVSLSTWLDGEHLACGFKMEARTSIGLAISTCKLAEESVDLLVGSLAERFRAEAWPKGLPVPRRLLVFRTRNGAGTAFKFAARCNSEQASILRQFLSGIDRLSAIWIAQGNRSGIVEHSSSSLLAGSSDGMHTLWHGHDVELSPFSFCQANPEAAGLVHEWLAEYTMREQPESVWDLYGGFGALGFAAAHASGNFSILEANPESGPVCAKLAEVSGRRSPKFICGDLLKTLPPCAREFSKADLIIVDPPRTGLHPQVLEIIERSKAANVVYLSCNPAKFGRDALRFSNAGFEVTHLQPYDFFPHTPDVELLAVLKRS